MEAPRREPTVSKILTILETPAVIRWRQSETMPEISRFHGIVIAMFYHEHGVPHFHASYTGHRISVEIETGIVRGQFPSGPLRLVLEWSFLHRQELLENCQRARQGKTLNLIDGLE
jgi:hypothetical protein